MSAHKPIKKAVFPVAGLGTRFLPATKAIPKELLPIVDRPLIQYAVDEAREAGIEQIIFVTGRGKTAIVEHFDMAFELETTMDERGKDLSVLDPTRATPGDIITVRQQVPLGLGHAIWCARAIVGDEPFAILLPDELMVAAKGGGTGCMKQMVEAYDKVGGNLVCALEIPMDETPSYGVIDPGARDGVLTEVKGLVEKPKLGPAPSNLIVSPFKYPLRTHSSASDPNSLASPSRFGKGTSAASLSKTGCGTPLISGVSKMPGKIVFTRIPSDERSRASVNVMPANAALDAE